MSETDTQKKRVDVDIPPMAVTVHAQYVKDFSFENPGAPDSLRPSSAKTEMDVKILMDAVKIEDGVNQNLYESALTLHVKAVRDGKAVFIVELVYAALVSIQDVPASQIKSILYVEIPQMLFPFARQMVATMTTEGGFPPLLLKPVDFRSMYANSRKDHDALEAVKATGPAN